MCGFVGFWEHVSSHVNLAAKVSAMAHEMAFRGPDGEGVWVDESTRLALGHRRLAIQDLSEAGFQPMHSVSGRYVMAYNGEVYNPEELRPELAQKGYTFKGHSDTEVMLAAIEVWGLDHALSKFIGMFAFALWDRQEKKLYLVRDRLGVKPLYWAHINGTYFFGSQLRAFRPHPHWTPTFNTSIVPSYLELCYVPAPHTIYQEAHKVRPGHYIVLEHGKAPVEHCYWSLENAVTRPIDHTKSTADWIDETHILLKDAVKKRMLADVPLGAFLSGGIDSSLVVALMQAQSSQPIKTFTIGFEEPVFDEAPFAKDVALHLGTDHQELYLPISRGQEIIPSLATHFDEPFADSSQIPTMLVSQLARTKVTVALSGDGGDEIYAGYTRYLLGYNLWEKTQGAMRPLMKTLVALGIPALKIPGVLSLLSRFVAHPREKALKLQQILSHDTVAGFYGSLIANGTAPGITGVTKPASLFNLPLSLNQFDHPISWMQYADLATYLPDDILTKVDRASMAYSLEAREPLLDHRLLEKSFQMPLALKKQGAQGKWILRQILSQYVPDHLINRPKMGFGVPIHQWLRGDLRDWAESLLQQDVEAVGLNATAVQALWEDYLAERNQQTPLVWAILMLLAWYKEANPSL